MLLGMDLREGLKPTHGKLQPLNEVKPITGFGLVQRKIYIHSVDVKCSNKSKTNV